MYNKQLKTQTAMRGTNLLKTIVLLLILPIMSVAQTVFTENDQILKDFDFGTGGYSGYYSLSVECPGTYQYYYDENNKQILHGKRTYNGSDSEEYSGGFTLKGSYNATANYSEGVLNGALTIKQNRQIIFRGTFSDNISLSGNYDKGVPDGEWKLINTGNLNPAFGFQRSYDRNIFGSAVYGNTSTNGESIAGKISRNFIVRFKEGRCVYVYDKEDDKENMKLSIEDSGMVSGNDGGNIIKNGIATNFFMFNGERKQPGEKEKKVIQSIVDNNGHIDYADLIDQGYLSGSFTIQICDEFIKYIREKDILKAFDNGYGYGQSIYDKFSKSEIIVNYLEKLRSDEFVSYDNAVKYVEELIILEKVKKYGNESTEILTKDIESNDENIDKLYESIQSYKKALELLNKDIELYEECLEQLDKYYTIKKAVKKDYYYEGRDSYYTIEKYVNKSDHDKLVSYLTDKIAEKKRIVEEKESLIEEKKTLIEKKKREVENQKKYDTALKDAENLLQALCKVKTDSYSFYKLDQKFKDYCPMYSCKIVNVEPIDDENYNLFKIQFTFTKPQQIVGYSDYQDELIVDLKKEITLSELYLYHSHVDTTTLSINNAYQPRKLAKKAIKEGYYLYSTNTDGKNIMQVDGKRFELTRDEKALIDTSAYKIAMETATKELKQFPKTKIKNASENKKSYLPIKNLTIGSCITNMENGTAEVAFTFVKSVDKKQTETYSDILYLTYKKGEKGAEFVVDESKSYHFENAKKQQ